MALYTSYIMVGQSKSIEAVVQRMYSSTNDNNISEYYAQISQILLECVSTYSESILQIFDFEALVCFLKQIDKVMKEKGTQIIYHFLHTYHVDSLLQGKLDSSKIDYVCEEVSNFSYLFHTYCNFVASLIYRQQASGSVL